MKKLILILCLLCSIQLEANAQQDVLLTAASGYNPVKPVSFSSTNYFGPGKDHDFYLRRSKTYRIVGWSTLGGGIVLSGLGLLIGSREQANNNDNVDYTIPGLLLLTGAVSGIVSIPFMIMASAYKHKAKLMISNQKTGFGVPSNVSGEITSITMIIPIGK